jgi:hypothetical protein
VAEQELLLRSADSGAFSKKIENHAPSVAIFFTYHFGLVQQTLKSTRPAKVSN